MQGDDDAIATSSLLQNAKGIQEKTFPKTYKVRVTWAFFLYLASLAILLFGYTAAVYVYEDDPVLTSPFIFLFDAIYILFLFALIFWQVPIYILFLFCIGYYSFSVVAREW